MARPSKGDRRKPDDLWERLYHEFTLNREEFDRHYHIRSNAETAFHMIKAKFGDSLKAKTDTAQVNEALLKVLCHNVCVNIKAMHQLGISPTFPTTYSTKQALVEKIARD